MGTQDRDQFDDLLDAALKHYGAVEARVGLETRVLARLTGAQDRGIPRSRWTLAFAIVSCACLVFVVLAIRSTRDHVRKVEGAMQIHPAVSRNQKIGDARAASSNQSTPAVARSPHANKEKNRFLTAAAETVPHLRQFPSPMPLTNHERLLKEYVRAFPHEATMVAQEQILREQEFEKLVASQYPSNDRN